MKKLLIKSAAIALFASASLPFALAQTAAFKEIRIATEAGYAPFEYIAPSGEHELPPP